MRLNQGPGVVETHVPGARHREAVADIWVGTDDHEMRGASGEPRRRTHNAIVTDAESRHQKIGGMKHLQHKIENHKPK